MERMQRLELTRKTKDFSESIILHPIVSLSSNIRIFSVDLWKLKQSQHTS